MPCQIGIFPISGGGGWMMVGYRGFVGRTVVSVVYSG